MKKVADQHSYIDEISRYMFLFGLATDVVVLMTMFLKKSRAQLLTHILLHVAITLVAFAYAASAHEFFWWMIPRSASNLFFYWNLYFFVPLIFVLSIIANFNSDSLFGIKSGKSKHS